MATEATVCCILGDPKWIKPMLKALFKGNVQKVFHLKKKYKVIISCYNKLLRICMFDKNVIM